MIISYCCVQLKNLIFITNMKIFYLFLLLALTSCYGQKNKTLTFVNKSSNQIDSIVVIENKNINLGKLNVGQQYSKHLTNVKFSTNNEGIFSFVAYLNDKKFTGSWGFHDFGMFSSSQEAFYVFDNGISYSDKKLIKPQEFKLYFYNTTEKNIDTILSPNNSIIKINERTPRSIEIIYDYNKFESSPEFIAVLSADKMSLKIDFHDFCNWNNNQAFLNFSNGKLKEDPLEWKEPLEYIIDLQIKIQIPADSVVIESIALTKTYNYDQPKFKKIVFDFNKLKQNPIVKVKVGNKNYTINFSSHDFSNIYDHQSIYILEEQGIRSLR